MEKYDNLKNRNDLAKLLEIPLHKLTYVLYKFGVDNMYTSFEIPKKSGGVRNINAPMKELKTIQKKLSHILVQQQNKVRQENKIIPNISHAFEKDKNIITNAEIHRNKKFVLNIDLEDFFNSFHFGRVKGFFEKNKHFMVSTEVATIIAQLSCYKGVLPQGAPSSPIITNLICNTLDMKLLGICRKYKLNYTRYADDLTFSTNNKAFLDSFHDFYKSIEKVIIKSGFKINTKKTRLQFKHSKQEVTGLIVNKKINVDRKYYKTTRAMAHNLYTNGEFLINEQLGSIIQLEGRFSFINQIDKYNNKLNKKIDSSKKISFFNLSSREKQYQQFLVYKYFFANTKPLIITEGKTDIDYIKSALKNMYQDYPNLISKNSDGTFKFNITFLRRSKRLNYFLCISKDGADTIKNIYNYYSDKNDNSFPNYIKYFTQFGVAKNPVIMLLDNELTNKGKPLYKLLDYSGLLKETNHKDFITNNHYLHINDNLYILTHELVKNNKECEIEDLFETKILQTKIDGKTFERNEKIFNPEINYSKAIFADYINKNYKEIDFTNFKSMLNNLDLIIQTYENIKSTKNPLISQL